MHGASSGFEAEATAAGDSEVRRSISFHTPGSDTERQRSCGADVLSELGFGKQRNRAWHVCE